MDEIEKTHPSVQDPLLGLLEEGRITSGRGLTYDARHCVVVFTTNALDHASLQRHSIGFATQAQDVGDVRDLLAEHFKPEFLGRLEICLFNPLGPDQIRAILRLRLGEVVEKIATSGYRVRFNEERMLNHLTARLAEERGAGARGVARVVEKHFVQPLTSHLATRLLHGDSGKSAEIVMDDLFADRIKPIH